MFQVEQIVCHRYNSKGLDEYLVYWKGFDISSATWEPVENLLSCTDLIQQFQRVNNPIPGQCYSSTGQINRLSIGFQIYWISILGNCKGHRFMILQNIFELNPGATMHLSGQARFLRIRHFDKHFIYNTPKKGPAGKNFGVFSPRYS